MNNLCAMDTQKLFVSFSIRLIIFLFVRNILVCVYLLAAFLEKLYVFLRGLYINCKLYNILGLLHFISSLFQAPVQSLKPKICDLYYS